MGYVDIFIKTFLLGIIVSAPMGPMGLLVVRRTLNRGMFWGWVSGLGVGMADILFSLIALFGVSSINISIESKWVRIVGAITLIIVGFFMMRANTVSQVRKPISGKTFYKYFLSAFMLALTNPVIILFFAASFAAMGVIPSSMDTMRYVIVLLGVIAGVVTWWTLITFILSYFRKKISLRTLVVINKISGIIIFILGVLALISVFLNIKI